MILFIDNYDSFTYNLVQYFGQLKQPLKVVRNDKISLHQLKKINPSHIVISPGPCTPHEAGMSCAIIKEFAPSIPMLGVCLGHQCIAESFGAKIVRAKELMHGKTSKIFHDQKGLFTGIPNPFVATRYHSLVIKENTLPPELKITARTKDGTIMGIEHKSFALFGVQFHPESILTKEGMALLKNFLKISNQRRRK
ncbi:MAG: aminodeoxychorismate/anthranilate synthase component II [Candidatus Omnitrophota bacterium]